MSKPQKRRCKEDGCSGKARPKRKDCYKCSKRKWRAANPLKAQFARLRAKASERGIEFTITLACFTIFCHHSGYVEGVGNEAHSLTVDRIDNLLGYVPGNIAPMTRSNNSVKQAKQDAVRMKVGFSWRG